MSQPGGLVGAGTRPSWALGLCDICGFSRKLNTLQMLIYDQKPTGLLVCPECNDKDNPQLQLGRFRVDDPQSLLDPRPDVGVQGSTTYFGWLPVGGATTLYLQCNVGTVTVLTS